MQQKHGFSFGYKNLIDRTHPNPGPGHYYFNQSSINLATIRKLSSTKIIHKKKIERIIEEPIPKTVYKSTFAKSARNEICLQIPMISRGPQSYNVSLGIGSPSQAIDIAKYSKRIFDHRTSVPGVGTYYPQDVHIRKNNHQRDHQQVEEFRQLSYLQKVNSLGPCAYDPKNNDEKLAYRFASAERIHEQASDQPCVGEYIIQDQLEYESTPKFSFNKYMPKFQSSYLIRKKFLEETPSSSSYNTTKSFQNAVSVNRSTKFSKSSRQLSPVGTIIKPGPGSYDPYQVNENKLKKQLLPKDDISSVNFIRSKNIKEKNLQHLVDNKRISIKEALECNKMTMKNIYKKFEPGPGQYHIAQNIIGVKHQFSVSERKDEFLDPFGINHAANKRAPQIQKNNIKRLESFNIDDPKYQLFRIHESNHSPQRSDHSSIFQKNQVTEKKRLGRNPTIYVSEDVK